MKKTQKSKEVVRLCPGVSTGPIALKLDPKFAELNKKEWYEAAHAQIMERAVSNPADLKQADWSRALYEAEEGIRQKTQDLVVAHMHACHVLWEAQGKLPKPEFKRIVHEDLKLSRNEGAVPSFLKGQDRAPPKLNPSHYSALKSIYVSQAL